MLYDVSCLIKHAAGASFISRPRALLIQHDNPSNRARSSRDRDALNLRANLAESNYAIVNRSFSTPVLGSLDNNATFCVRKYQQENETHFLQSDPGHFIVHCLPLVPSASGVLRAERYVNRIRQIVEAE